MSAVYTARAGDTVDYLCWRYYGDVGATLRVLDANPGLAALGAALPAGTRIVLPDLPTAVRVVTIQRIWG